MSGALLFANISCWLHMLAHTASQYRYVLCSLAAAIQLLLLVLTLSMLWQFEHMPAYSELKFIADYPQYSLFMAWERLGLQGLVGLSVVYSLLVFSWLNSDADWFVAFHRQRKYWLASLGLLIAGNVLSSANEARSIEMHYVGLVSSYLRGDFDRPAGSDNFHLNRISLPAITVEKSAGGDNTRRPNILFFRMEEVSRDHYGLYTGAEHPTTPFISALKQHSPNSFFTYSQHVSNAGATDTSTTLIYTGLGSHRKGAEFGYYPMLWDYAKAAGYQTFMAVPFHLTWGNLAGKWAANSGQLSLDTVVDAKRSGREIRYDNSITDSDIADITIDWLTRGKSSEPFLAIVNLKLPHGDASGVQTLGYEQLNCPLEPRRLSDYECSIFVLDREMGRIISALEQQGELENTIIIGAPDHGAAQGKHHKGRLYNYYQEVLSIPLFLRIPPQYQFLADRVNRGWRGNVDKTTQNLDILPTIVDLLGIGEHPLISGLVQELDGQSVFAPISEQRWVFSMNSNALRPWKPSGFGITIGNSYKYIYFESEEYLYDLAKDPGEQFNLLEQPQSLAPGLYAEIRRYIRANPAAKELYAYRFPVTVSYDEAFEFTLLGKDMHSIVGTIEEGSTSLVSQQTPGVLSYGPYITLAEGHYEFKTDYTLHSEEALASPSHYALGYTEAGRWIGLTKGVYEPGESMSSSVHVAVTPEYANKHLELVNHYTGEGRFEIARLSIYKVVSETATD